MKWLLHWNSFRSKRSPGLSSRAIFEWRNAFKEYLFPRQAPVVSGATVAGRTLPARNAPSWSHLRRWVVPNIGRQLILERCIHGVAEQFQSRIRPEGNSALHNQPMLVVHDDLQALELVAIHGPHPAQKGGALIGFKLGCIGTRTTRGARLSENRRDDLTPLDRPYQYRAVEYDVFGKQLAHLGGGRLTGFP